MVVWSAMTTSDLSNTSAIPAERHMLLDRIVVKELFEQGSIALRWARSCQMLACALMITMACFRRADNGASCGRSWTFACRRHR